MISLSVLDRFPWWITILILAREVGITLFRLAVIKGGVIPANRGGKIKSAFQSFGVGFFMLPLPESLYWFRDGIISVAIALTIVTGFNYVRLAMKRP
jgi:CDP-diacylglycerol--glycerol-3-phosphate 3-phosphatidyltransferase